MGKNTKMKEELLQESNVDLLLKDYLRKMKKIFGEEYAILTLTSDMNISSSLGYFTSKFDNIDENDISFALLKGSLLSNEKNYFNEVIKSKVELGELKDVLFLVNENLSFRKSLTRTFLNQSNKTNKELYNELDSKEQTIENLSTLNFYEIANKARILEKKFISVRTI